MTNPICAATSNIPKIPIVEFTVNLAVLIPAVFISPWSILFGIVIKFERLLRKLLVPILIGDGNFLYPLATGSNIALSRPWLNANVALFTFSKQSLTSWFFFDSEFSPSVSAKEKLAQNKLIKRDAINFLILLGSI